MALIQLATGSTVEGINGENRTLTSISPQILIRVGPNAVGAIQEISFNERRDVQQVDEVGTDGHIDSVPVRSANIEGTCSRIRYDRMRIAEAFSRGFMHVKSQRIGFDIDIYDKWNGDGESGIIVTTLKNVWITGISYRHRATDFINADDMTFVAEDVYSSINGGNAATGGERGLLLQTDTSNIERQTDRGLRRGALDAPGLIRSVFNF